MPSEAPSGVLGYLLERYDGDTNGKITPKEHGRTPMAFSRLDRNGDGAIDARDFEGRSPGGERRRGDRAMLLVGSYLQADGNGSRLDLAELGQAFDERDANQDGVLTEEEFLCRVASPASGPSLQTPEALRLLEGRDPWKDLLDGIDSDADETLDREELLAFHLERGGGAAWQWAEDAGAEPGNSQERPLVGHDAPDFTLSSLNGGKLVTLSSFEGDRPVALIFGSYT